MFYLELYIKGEYNKTLIFDSEMGRDRAAAILRMCHNNSGDRVEFVRNKI